MKYYDNKSKLKRHIITNKIVFFNALIDTTSPEITASRGLCLSWLNKKSIKHINTHTHTHTHRAVYLSRYWYGHIGATPPSPRHTSGSAGAALGLAASELLLLVRRRPPATPRVSGKLQAAHFWWSCAGHSGLLSKVWRLEAVLSLRWTSALRITFYMWLTLVTL